jgi:hypothetical protein
MPENLSHGRPYQEPERHDELSSGVQAQAIARGQRRADGTFERGARTVQSEGGKATKEQTMLSHRIEAPTLTGVSVKRARTLRRALSGEIARTVGGGECGVAASLFLKFAAQKTAAAEEAFQRGDFEAHRKLSESARMDVLYAREHAAKTAEARKATTNAAPPWLTAEEGK